MKFKKLFDQNFFDKLGRDDIINMSASLAYYTALSLAPLLILAVTFVGVIGENFKQQLIVEVQELVGANAAETIKFIVESAEHRQNIRDWSGLFGLATLLVSAAAIFGQLRSSLNKIFDIRPEIQKQADSMSFWLNSVDYLKQKLFSMGMVLTFVFVSIVSLVISSFLTILFQGLILVLGHMINFLLSIFIFTILFSAIYYFLPQRKLSRRTTLSAGLITSILFSIGKVAIGLYLGQSALSSAYGAAGSMIVLLMWVYYSSLIVFVSAEIAYRVEKVFFHADNTLIT